VLAVEPMPATCAWLGRNLGVNGLEGVRALNLGLGRACGRLRLDTGVAL